MTGYLFEQRGSHGSRQGPPRPPSGDWPPLCYVELAPGHTFAVGESGLAINRELLVRRLPAALVQIEQARMLLRRPSPLAYVSNAAQGHCTIIWRGSWLFQAHKPVYRGGVLYENSVSAALERTTVLVLGMGGWPITVRLGCIPIPL